MLCSELISKRMLPYVATIKAREIPEFDNWIRHSGEEFVYALSGELIFFSERYRPLPMKQGIPCIATTAWIMAAYQPGNDDAQVLWMPLE